MKKIVTAKEALKRAQSQYVFAHASSQRAQNRFQAEEAQELVDDAKAALDVASENWEKVEAEALAEIADLQNKIKGLQRQLKEINPNASQEDSEQYWDEIPHAIHALQVKVAQIKAQLNA